MKTIQLEQIHMINFMGEKERTTTFNSVSNVIKGANGLGKTRHFDAFLWLLFGKDSAGRKDYEIRTKVNSEPLHEVECSVSAVISVDGEIINLKRSYVEEWVKPQGKAERVLKGNRTDCWWNDTPVKVGEYEKRVSEIIDSTLFRMITDPSFFPSLNWKEQRQSLFDIAGDIDEEKIISESPEFKKLVDSITGKSLADFKAELSSEKKRLNLELSEIQPRIDQTHRLMPETSDFAVIEKRIAEIDAEVTTIDKSIADTVAGESEKYEAERKLQSQINDIKRSMDTIVNDAKDKNIEEARKINAKFNEWNNELRELHAKLASNTILLNRNKHEEETLVKQRKGKQDIIVKLQAQIEECRDKWKKENARKFEDDVCPYCGQPLPSEMLEDTKKSFFEMQKKAKDEILSSAEVLKAQVKTIETDNEETEATIATMPEAITALTKENEDIQKQIDALTEKITNTERAVPVEVIPENIEAWKQSNTKIDSLQTKISEIKAQAISDTSVKSTLKNELNAERTKLVNELANRNIIEKSLNEIHNLEERAKELAQKIAELEQREFIMQEFSKRRVEEMERKVNSMFSIVTWKLFDYTLEGNPVEVCTPLVNGVPYGRVNSASRVNAGLDIINVLCAKYGVSAPIFLDNAEGVNEHIKSCGQVIKLYVTKDNKLIINQ